MELTQRTINIAKALADWNHGSDGDRPIWLGGGGLGEFAGNTYLLYRRFDTSLHPDRPADWTQGDRIMRDRFYRVKPLDEGRLIADRKENFWINDFTHMSMNAKQYLAILRQTAEAIRDAQRQEVPITMNWWHTVWDAKLKKSVAQVYPIPHDLAFYGIDTILGKTGNWQIRDLRDDHDAIPAIATIGNALEHAEVTACIPVDALQSWFRFGNKNKGWNKMTISMNRLCFHAEIEQDSPDGGDNALSWTGGGDLWQDARPRRVQISHDIFKHIALIAKDWGTTTAYLILQANSPCELFTIHGDVTESIIFMPLYGREDTPAMDTAQEAVAVTA